MAVEQVPYLPRTRLRLGVTAEAARALTKRHHLPRSRSNDGRTFGQRRRRRASAYATARTVTAVSPPDHRPEDPPYSRRGLDPLEAELADEQQRSAGHRADFEHERDRGDRMVTGQNRLIAELETSGFLVAALAETRW